MADPSGRQHNILIHTGGTISTESSDGFLRVGKASISKYFGEYSYDKEYSPFCVLSENLTLSHLVSLANLIDSSGAKGVIITAGTDNLSFMANFLDLYFSPKDKTIVIVSADLPLSDKNSNGFDNINTAIKFVKMSARGVYVCYKNKSENITKVHYGSRVLPLFDFDGYCHSAYNGIACVFDGNKFLPKSSEFKEVDGKFVRANTNFNKDWSIMLDEKAVNFIHYIKPHICFDYIKYNSTIKNSDIVVSNSYHSGTVKTKGDNNIQDLACKVYVCGGEKNKVQYESKEEINKNIQFVDGITAQAFYIKCLLAYSMDKKSASDYLFANTCGEFKM